MLRDEERSGWNAAARKMGELHSPEMKRDSESSPHDCVLVLHAADRTIALLLQLYRSSDIVVAMKRERVL